MLLRSANSMKVQLEFQDGNHLGFSRWPLFKPNFAHNSKTKHNRKTNSKATPRFLGSTNPMKLSSEVQDGCHLGFSRWPPFKI